MQYDKKYWDERFNKNTPEPIKNAIIAVYAAYPPECVPQGVCDPMYIMNTIALYLGFGDGCGKFYLNDDHAKIYPHDYQPDENGYCVVCDKGQHSPIHRCADFLQDIK